MVIEKRDHALLVKLFYLNGSKSSAALREYRRLKGLRRCPIRVCQQMCVAPGKGRRPIPTKVVEKVAVADRAERALNSATSARSVSHEFGVHWSTVRNILRCIL